MGEKLMSKSNHAALVSLLAVDSIAVEVMRGLRSMSSASFLATGR